MSLPLDIEFCKRILPYVKKGTQVRRDLFGFNCPYCGDKKQRGTLYRPGEANNMSFGCYNCGEKKTLWNFLKYVNYQIWKEYNSAKFLRKHIDTSPENEIAAMGVNHLMEDAVENRSIFSDLPIVGNLDRNHPAHVWCRERLLPDSSYSRLYFAEDFPAWSNKHADKQLRVHDNAEPRIIIPMVTEDGIEFGYQGRTIESDPKILRYISVYMDRRFSKQFGMDVLLRNELIYVVEGAMDSLFLPNSVAALDAALSTKADRFKLPHSNTVIIHDNEPRNREIVKQLRKSIEAGYSVVIFPKGSEQTGKDINEMVATVGIHTTMEMISLNTWRGLQAKLKFEAWRKV